MQFNRAELIEEIENNIRKYGGAFEEWCVGTGKDAMATARARRGL